MNNTDFKRLCNVILMHEGVKLKKLAQDLKMTYPYLSQMVNGKVPISENYINRLENYAKRLAIDTSNIYNQPQPIRVGEPDTPYIGKSFTPTQPAMTAGSSIEITTKVTLKNDQVTSYNVELKRIS